MSDSVRCPEEDQFVAMIPAQGRQDVRDRVVSPYLLLGDAEPGHDLGDFVWL
jgi:hypothetical protein